MLMLLLIGMVKLKMTVLGRYLLHWHKLYEIISLVIRTYLILFGITGGKG